MDYRRVRFVADRYLSGRMVADKPQDGFFHRWGSVMQDCQETGSVFSVTVAIIEDDEGGIHSISPERVHFYKPIKEEL